MTYPEATVLQGDCIERLRELPADSVHCCVTSPPYWGLRDYGTANWEGGDVGCDHAEMTCGMSEKNTLGQNGHLPATNAANLRRHRQYRDTCGKCGARRVDQQIGLEETPEAHIERMVEVFRAVWRVLRKDGTLFLNYGDCYACAPNGRAAKDVVGDDRTFRDKPFGTVSRGRRNASPKTGSKVNFEMEGPNRFPQIGLKPKDLIGMPWRLALALQADGWWLRSDIVWSKPNPMPESVTDRPTRSHEYLFLLAKSERYYFDQDAIREKHSAPERQGQRNSGWDYGSDRQGGEHRLEYNPAGRNRRTVWEIPTEPYAEAHFATFPRALVRPCVLAGTSARGVCGQCGAPWKRDTKASGGTIGKSWHDHSDDHVRGQRASNVTGDGTYRRQTTGWRSSCKCGADTVPAVCLDPFAGSGTVGEVALSLGRSAVLIELNPKYCRMIKKRLSRAQVPLMLEEDAAPVEEAPAEMTLLDLMVAD